MIRTEGCVEEMLLAEFGDLFGDNVFKVARRDIWITAKRLGELVGF